MGTLGLISSRNFITLNKELIKSLGLECAILIGELCSEYDYWEKNGRLDDGFFFSTVENIEENTTLTDFQQRKAFKKLKDMGLVETKLKGVPAKRYIRLIENNILNKLNSSSEKIKELDIKKLKTNNNIINKNNNNNISKVSKKEEKTSFDELIDAYTKNKDLADALLEFIKMRKLNKKPLTNRALQLIFNKLDTFTNKEEEKILIIENSIMNNWLSIYELKEKEKKEAFKKEKEKEMKDVQKQNFGW